MHEKLIATGEKSTSIWITLLQYYTEVVLLMALKSILVTYLERNKIFTLLPRRSGDAASDVTILEELFRKEFKFDSNVSLEITFQRLQVDSDWGEIYIDLDDDSTLNHKDKLKAVVTPVLTMPKNSSEVRAVYHL